MSENASYDYRDPSGITNGLSVCLWILFLFVIATIASLVMQYRLFELVQAHAFSSSDAMAAAAQTNDLRVQSAAIVSGILGFVAGITFLFWVYRVSANAHALGAVDLGVSAGFAVGMYFIPIVNLFMPPIVMDQIWRASIDAKAWKAQRHSVLIPVWWLFQLTVTVSSLALALAGRTGRDIETLKGLTAMLIAFYVADFIFRLTVLLLIRRISAAQIDQSARADSPHADMRLTPL